MGLSVRDDGADDGVVVVDVDESLLANTHFHGIFLDSTCNDSSSATRAIFTVMPLIINPLPLVAHPIAYRFRPFRETSEAQTMMAATKKINRFRAKTLKSERVFTFYTPTLYTPIPVWIMRQRRC